MRVELINTGSELLLGQVTNTHLPWLGQELLGLGLRFHRQTTVPDGEEIRSVALEASRRSDLVIVTGGLGPTSDDLTREIIAELLERPLEHDESIWQHIIAYFERRGWTAPETTRVQALVPRGALVLPNDHGTAPGLLIEAPHVTFILLPGPPRELKPMWTNYVLPWLRNHRPLQPLHQQLWHILGIGESRVQEIIEQPLRDLGVEEIGYCARPGEVDLRAITPRPELLPAADRLVRELLGDYLSGEGNTPLEQLIVPLATERGLTIATAESCTGGLIAHRLTSVPGSSACFGFGWVTYANEAKMQELGVPVALLEQHGAVSEACVRAMAEGALRASGAQLAAAVSGIAGPGGGTDEKPVGTCWFAIATTKGTVAEHHRISRDRETFKFMASQLVLDRLYRALLKS